MDMFSSLLSQPSGKRVGPELLEMLGRKASDMYQQQGMPLNQAIAQLAAEHPELGNEHIKRVVEFANTLTFQELFSKSEDKNVHFDVADPGVVLRDLKDGGSPNHDGKTMSSGMGDYHSAPAQGTDSDLGPLRDLFASGSSPSQDVGDAEQVKTAAAYAGGMDHNEHANPIENVYDTHLRLQATHRQIAEAHDHFDELRKQAHEDLFQIVKKEALDPDGAGLKAVGAVLEKIATKDDVLAILTPMVVKLARDLRDRPRLWAGMEKKAGKVVNLSHPLVRAWAGLEKAAYEQARSAAALREVEDGLMQTTKFLKQAGALTTGVKNKVGVRGKVPEGVRQRFSRSR